MGSGPNCPPWKSGKLGPGQLGPGARLSGAQLSALKKCQIGPRTVGPQKFTFPKTKKSKHVIEIANSYVFPYIKYVTQHTKYTSKTQTVSVQIPNNHPKSHKHLKKCQKYHLNHKISTPKIEMSFKISNSLSKISDEPSKIQNNPPQSQRPHQKYNVHHPNYWNDILKLKKIFLNHQKYHGKYQWARGPIVQGPTVRPEKVTNWAPDNWAPGPGCPGPNCPPPKSGKLGPGQLGPGARLSGAQLSGAQVSGARLSGAQFA